MGWLWVSNLSIAIGTLLTTGKKEEVCVEVTVHLPLSVCGKSEDDCYTQDRRPGIDEWKYCGFI